MTTPTDDRPELLDEHGLTVTRVPRIARPMTPAVAGAAGVGRQNPGAARASGRRRMGA